jgi:elongation factor G
MDRRERILGPNVHGRNGAHPLVLTIPWGEEDRFQGVIDLLSLKAIKWREETLGVTFEELEIPADYQGRAAAAREALVEALGEVDDEVMEAYLAEQPLTVEALKAGIQRATLALKGVPTYCGSALRNKGIQPLLDGIKDFLPNPAQVPPIEGQNPKTGEAESRPPENDQPLAALAFKIMVDQAAPHLCGYSGTLKSGQGHNPQGPRKIGLSQDTPTSEPWSAGSLVALLGLKTTTTGALCSQDKPLSCYLLLVPVISGHRPRPDDGEVGPGVGPGLRRRPEPVYHHRRRHRPNLALRHGRTAPGGDPASPGTGIPRPPPGRPPPGGLPGNHRRGGRRNRDL